MDKKCLFIIFVLTLMLFKSVTACIIEEEVENCPSDCTDPSKLPCYSLNCIGNTCCWNCAPVGKSCGTSRYCADCDCILCVESSCNGVNCDTLGDCPEASTCWKDSPCYCSPVDNSKCVAGYVCGNGICESTLGETQSNCCVDCGCPPGQTCVNNVCQGGGISTTITPPGGGASGSITCNPSSFTIPEGETRTSTISWRYYNTDGNSVEIYVSIDSGNEQLFASDWGDSSGSQQATWISAPHTYRFTLYEGISHSNVLDSCTVTADLQDTTTTSTTSSTTTSSTTTSTTTSSTTTSTTTTTTTSSTTTTSTTSTTSSTTTTIPVTYCAPTCNSLGYDSGSCYSLTCDSYVNRYSPGADYECADDNKHCCCYYVTTTSSSIITTTVMTTTTTTQQPDLVITDIWTSGSRIYYRIRNQGNANARYSYSKLWIDNSYKARDYVPSISAGSQRIESFYYYTWICSGQRDQIRVCADGDYGISESNEANNCREETFNCLITTTTSSSTTTTSISSTITSSTITSSTISSTSTSSSTSTTTSSSTTTTAVCPPNEFLYQRICREYTHDEWNNIHIHSHTQYKTTTTISEHCCEQNNRYYACEPNDADTACCPDDNCVYNGVCYPPGTLLDIDNDGIRERCVAGSNGVWIETVLDFMAWLGIPSDVKFNLGKPLILNIYVKNLGTDVDSYSVTLIDHDPGVNVEVKEPIISNVYPQDVKMSWSSVTVLVTNQRQTMSFRVESMSDPSVYQDIPFQLYGKLPESIPEIKTIGLFVIVLLAMMIL